MGLIGKRHKKEAAEYVLENASDFHEAFGTTPAVYNEEREQIEALPATEYECLNQALTSASSRMMTNFQPVDTAI
jgi:hypothetical protein